jgi:hAT family C-terminal dimerisation region
VWRCLHCKSKVEYVITGGTRIVKDHLSRVHQLTEELPLKDAKRKRADEDIQASIARMNEVGKRIRLQRVANASELETDPLVVRELFVNWLAADSLPFSLCKSRAFRTFLQYISPSANELLPESDTTIHQDILDCYVRLKSDVKQRLQSALSLVHITCDLWTSGNRLGLMGIVAHFVDEDGILHSLTIGLREMEGSHSGENMAKILWDVLSEYQILTKLGYFTMDNASNNDVMLSVLERRLREEEIDWDSTSHRLRCSGHIIQLSVGDCLFGNHPHLSDSDDLTREDITRWRQLGPLGKLHNIVVWVQRSPQRMQAFKKDSSGKAPKRDNSTRWNSWFEMLDWSLKPELRLAIEKVSFSEKDLYNDRLTEGEWATLAKIRDFLQPFKDTTMATQGRAATLEHVLPSMDFLLQHFEDAKTTAAKDNDPIMVACIEAGWAKLDHYYNLTDRSPVYIAAIVLNPKWKFEYFTSIWTSEWIEDAKRKLRRFWEEHYQSKGVSAETVTKAIAPTPKNAYQAWINSKLAPVDCVDEYTRYLTDPTLPHIVDALPWWVQQRGQYPALGTMAIDILSIPGMSDEPERVFSGARRTITDFRGSLKASSIEMLECIKSWRGLS